MCGCFSMSAVRPSIEERYGTHEKYVPQVRDAAERLDDADRLIAQAEV